MLGHSILFHGVLVYGVADGKPQWELAHLGTSHLDPGPQILLQGHSVDATVLRIILLAAHCQGGGVAEDEARA